MIGWDVAWAWAVACRAGESSQQPTWPHARQMRRWSHFPPARGQSPPPPTDSGSSVAWIWSRCEPGVASLRRLPGAGPGCHGRAGCRRGSKVEPMDDARIREAVESRRDAALATHTFVHEHPELAHAEHECADHITAVLEAAGLEVE